MQGTAITRVDADDQARQEHELRFETPDPGLGAPAGPSWCGRCLFG